MDVPGQLGSVAVEVGSNFGTLVVGNHNVIQVQGAIAPVIEAQIPAAVHRPTEPEGFLDRRAETTRAVAALAPGRVVEISGPRAIGKTFFLQHAATAAASSFRDGALALPPGLAGAQDVTQSVFEMFYRATPEVVPSPTRLREYLAGKQALLLLDDMTLPASALTPLFDALRQCTLLAAAEVATLGAEASASLTLAGLPVDDALALMERVHGAPLAGPLAAQALAQCEALGGHPRRLIEAARTLGAGQPVAAAEAPEADARAILDILRAFAPRAVPRAVLAELSGVPAPGEPLGWLLQRGLVHEGADGGLNLAHQLTEDDTPTATAANATRLEQAVAGLQRLGQRAGASPARRRLALAALPLLWHTLSQAREVGVAAHTLALGRAWHAALALGGRWDAWARLLSAHLLAARRAGDAGAVAWALHQSGTRELGLGQLDAARTLFEQSLREGGGLADPALQAASHDQLELIRHWPPPVEPPAPPPPTPRPPDPASPAPILPAASDGSLLGLKSVVVGGLAVLLGSAAWWVWSAPKLAFDPPALTFEPLTLSAAAAATGRATVRLVNHGRRAAPLPALRVEGGDGAFAVEPIGTGCGGELAGGASCEVVLRFTPARRGSQQAQLKLESDPATAVALSGVGLAGELQVAPATELDFGAVESGVGARRQAVLTNAGDAPLRVTPPSLGSGPFRLASNTCQSALAPRQTCTIEIDYRAAQSGRDEATLTLQSDVPGDAARGVTLRAQTLSARLELGAQELPFAPLDAGQTSPSSPLRVFNRGDAALRDLAVRIEPADAPFVADTSRCRAPLPPSGECELGVQFRARPPGGARSARLVVQAAKGGSATVALSGRVRAAELRATPAEGLRFGSIDWPLRGAPPERSVRISNTGDAALQLASPRLQGAQAGDFRIGASTCGGSLPPGGSCDLALRYQPFSARSSAAELALMSGSAGVAGAFLALSGEARMTRLPPPVLRAPPDEVQVSCRRGSSFPMLFAWTAPESGGTALSYRLLLGTGRTVDAGSSTSVKTELPCGSTTSWRVEARAGALTSLSETRRLISQPASEPAASTPTLPQTPPPSSTPATPGRTTTPKPGPSIEQNPAATVTAPSGRLIIPAPATTIEQKAVIRNPGVLNALEPVGKCCRSSRDEPPIDARRSACQAAGERWFETTAAPKSCFQTLLR